MTFKSQFIYRKFLQLPNFYFNLRWNSFWIPAILIQKCAVACYRALSFSNNARYSHIVQQYRTTIKIPLTQSLKCSRNYALTVFWKLWDNCKGNFKLSRTCAYQEGLTHHTIQASETVKAHTSCCADRSRRFWVSICNEVWASCRGGNSCRWMSSFSGWLGVQSLVTAFSIILITPSDLQKSGNFTYWRFVGGRASKNIGDMCSSVLLVICDNGHVHGR